MRTSDSLGVDTGARLGYIQFSQQPDCEYVELVNISDRDIDIGGWALTTSGGWVGTIPQDTIIKKKDYMVLVGDRDDSWAFMKDEEGVIFEPRSDDICFKNTWPDVDLDEHVRALELSGSPVDIAEDVVGETIALPGSIFEDSPLLTPKRFDDFGTATSADVNSLTIATNNWTDDQWVGATIKIIGGVGVGQIRLIISNTEDTVTISSNWTTIPDATSDYHIHLDAPGAVTLWEGLLKDRKIVAQVDYLAEDVNETCYIQSDGTPVYGFIALEKNDPTAISDFDEDAVDDSWLINIGEQGLSIAGVPMPGGTPGGINSVVPDDKDPAVDMEIRNLPFATIGDIKEVSTSDTTNEWSKIGYDADKYEDDTDLIALLADKITVSEKRLEAENSEYYHNGNGTWGPIESPADETFLTPYYSTSAPALNPNDTGIWIWGIDQRINPDTAFYTLYISGKVLRETIDSSDTMLVKVTTGVTGLAGYDTRELSFSQDNIAEYGQITIGGAIPYVGGDTALLMLEIWKDYPAKHHLF